MTYVPYWPGPFINFSHQHGLPKR